MEIEVKDISQARKRLAITVPQTDVVAEFERTLKQARAELSLPGFRKGKAPMELVKARVGEGLGTQVAETIRDRFVPEALRRESLEPVGVFLDLEDGQEDMPPAKEGESYGFAILVDLVPEIEPESYTGLKIARPKVELEDDEVQKEMNGLRESLGHLHDVEDRASQSGDFVEVEIEGEEPGGTLSLERKEQRIHLGAEGNLPEFERGLSGLRAGDEFAFDVDYPEDFPSDDYKGKRMRFSGCVKSIRERHVPEWSDELAGKVAGVETVAELRDKVEESLRARKELEATGVAKRRLLDKLLDMTPFDVPPSLVERELQNRLETIGRNMAMRGIDPNKAEIDWDRVIGEERGHAEKAVREQLLLDRIATKEKLDVTREEVDRAIEGMARESGQEPAAVRQQLTKERALNSLKTEVLRRKCLDWVYEKTNIC